MKYKIILAGLLLALLLAPGCGTKVAPTPAFDQATIAVFDSFMAEIRSYASAEGSVLAVWAPGKGEYVKAAGTDEVTTGSAIDPSKLFRIASITKTFSCTVALQMVDEGLINLDDKVSTYITGVPSGDSITLRMLFNHTSGLPNHTGNPAFWTDFIANRLRQFTPQELLNYAWALPMQSAPGAGYHYSNDNTILLGLIVEKVNREGETMAQAVKRRVIDKIGLQNTYFPTTENFPGPYIHGYQLHTTPGTIDDWSIQNPSWIWAAGAVISNIYDLKTYIKAISTNSAGLLSPALQTKRLNDDWVSTGGTTLPTAKYGLGWAQLGGFFYHDGACYGYHSIVAYDPSTDTTVVAMINIHPSDLSTCTAILIKVIQTLFPGRAI